MAGLVNPSAVPIQSIAERSFLDLTNLIILYGLVDSGGNCTLRKQSGSSGYAVTTGKTLTLRAAQIFTYAAGSDGERLVIAQSDNDVGVNTSTALTNPVYIGGSSVLSEFCLVGMPGIYEIPLDFQVAATKFTTITVANVEGFSIGRAHVKLFGYEA